MTIPEKTILPTHGDYQTIYLNAVIDNPVHRRLYDLQ